MKNKDYLKNGYFAHRGLHNNAYPENTIAAFTHAFEHGFSIELDIRLTKDNKVVVVHDDDLTRLTNTPLTVSDSTYDEIKNLQLHHTEFTIPLLSDVLAIIPKEIPVLIELKSCFNNRLLVEQFMEIIKAYDIDYSVLSFDPRIVRYFRKHYPHVERGFIRKFKHSKLFVINLLILFVPFIKFTKPDFIMHKRSDIPNKKMNRFIKKKPVLAYTCTSNGDLEYVRSIYTNAVFEGFIPKQK